MAVLQGVAGPRVELRAAGRQLSPLVTAQRQRRKLRFGRRLQLLQKRDECRMPRQRAELGVVPEPGRIEPSVFPRVGQANSRALEVSQTNLCCCYCRPELREAALERCRRRLSGKAFGLR